MVIVVGTITFRNAGELFTACSFGRLGEAEFGRAQDVICLGGSILATATQLELAFLQQRPVR
jgi:hypothetical protein